MNRLIALAALALFAACATTPPPPPPPKEEPKPVAAPTPPPDPEAWRAKQPAGGPAPTLKLPVFQKATLKNGLTVLVSEHSELPVVSLQVAFRAGSAADPKDKDGLADLTYGLMLEGAGKYDALGLADAFGNLGVSPGKGTDRDGALVGVTVHRRNTEPALALLADVVQRPRFAAKDFDRKKKQQLADLAEQVGNPRFLQRWAMASVTFGDEHPYGHLSSGVPSTIQPLSLADVKGFYAKNVGPSGAVLIVTGKATLAEATAWAEKYFGKWRSKAPAPGAPPLAAPGPRTEVVLVPKAGLNQTVIAAGRPAIRSGDPEYGALLLANLVFGGNFISRLNMNLREDKAYTYGTYSAVQTLRSGGLIVAGGSVRADVTGPSMTEVLKELEGLKSRPITPAEVEAARAGFILSLPGEFETTERVANAATGIYWHDEPLDHFEKLIAEVRGADLPRVQAAAERFFDPALIKFVLVGDPEVVTKQVGSLGLGNIVQRAPPQPPAAPVAKAKK